jgi:hypothetical protein
LPEVIVGTAVRKMAMYSIEMNWIVMPRLRARLRPMKSTRKKAHRRAETNFTTPKMAVAKSFSDWPVVPRSWKN